MTEQPRFDRQYDEDSRGADDGDIRSAGRHDRDRILYSSALRRLSGITQVISPSGRHPTHNRLTHTLEVAQIARSIAETLEAHNYPKDLVELAGGLSPDVAEAAALAHDLGHPPFGHVAETALNGKVGNKGGIDGFEGNAQSFRILSKLAIRDEEFVGLNLTRATLSAVSKYPWRKGSQPKNSEKWGAYNSEADELNWSREHLHDSLKLVGQDAGPEVRTLEARIMDWSDDVAYAVHDLEDFYRVGSVPLDRIKQDASEQDRFLRYHFARLAVPNAEQGAQEALFRDLLSILSPFDRPYEGGKSDQAKVRRFTSTFVHRYISNASLTEDRSSQGWTLSIPEELRLEVDLLKGLTWYYVIDSRPLITQRYGHTKLIESLFDVLLDASRKGQKSIRIFPKSFQESLSDSDSSKATRKRIVADFMSSMTESQVVDLHHRLTGITLGSALDQIVD